MKSANTEMARACGKLGLVALAIVASPFAMADDAGWYAGANVGQARATIDDIRITKGLVAIGANLTSITDADRASGYKIYGGYRLNNHWSVEGGYFDLGQFSFNATTAPAGALSGNTKLRGLNLDLVGTLPITQKFRAFGRLGVNYAQANDTFVGTGIVHVIDPSPNKRDTNLKVGLGVEYAINNALLVRAELERYRINDAVGNKGDIDMVSLGLVYQFGPKTPTPVAYAVVPVPIPVITAPQPIYVPPPVMLPPPPPPPPPKTSVPTKVTFSADSLFDFDKSSLKPKGQQDLNKFAADLNGSRFDVIKVTGHTDRIGAHAYNLKLSQRRAETVKNYLVEANAIAPNKIAAQGVDGSAPVTQPGDCTGTKASKALIACLQPDRRVEVEVSATR
jgi:OOP family OmpA-OmpF porin